VFPLRNAPSGAIALYLIVYNALNTCRILTYFKSGASP
jgi:hypothetical protein